MSVKKRLNNARREFMRSLTKNIGKGNRAGEQKFLSSKVNRVLISRPNHRLGNLLLITPLLQEVILTFPDAKIDLFVKGGIAPLIFKEYEAVDQIISLPRKPMKELRKYLAVWVALKKNKYDIVINVDKGSSSGRISANIANAGCKVFGDEFEEGPILFADYQHIAKQPIYNFRNILPYFGKSNEARPIPAMDMRLTTEEIAAGKKILTDLVKNDRKSICIFTFATGDKCYPPSWWEPFYELLLKEFPNYNIVEMLPAENVSQINFKAPSFYSMDVREMGAVLNNMAVFIGADSGIVHLAEAAKVPTVALFSVTDKNIYQPYRKKSLGINTNETSIEDCVEIIKTILGSQ